MKTIRYATAVSVSCFSMLASPSAQALEWSDTSLSVRYGTQFAEPYISNPDGSRTDISKMFYTLSHVNGYRYGTNFLSLMYLDSDRSDPKNSIPGSSGANEVYFLYRHTLDLGRVMNKDLRVGPVRGWGLTAGFDLNRKNDGYSSRKRTLVVGPTVMFDVPGQLDVSLLLLRDSNQPRGLPSRYWYKSTYAIVANAGLPIGRTPFAIEGYLLHNHYRGRDEFGGPMAAETHLDISLMYDLGLSLGYAPRKFRVGVSYEFWKNKFGRPTTLAGQGAGPGATAKTPMLRVQYHF